MREPSIFIFVCSLLAVIVLAARFLDAWKKEETQSWENWGSPNLAYNFGMYFSVVFGGVLNDSKSSTLLKARKNLRVAFCLLLVSGLTLVFVL
ncbi:hypothetical protein [Methylophaga sp. OBS1]|uniref:hypothetical protein n=1 Tax=Methylophaga sp. OBS1 TaxID=2991933 RepID=UPI00224DF47C|nr:hypothetical protein [Methylophaga sp. OBS1]MCX4194041.1 hypothetical protein [Methylophaga sp. OBS1]